MTTILEAFSDLNITINNQQILTMERMVIHFILRKTHPLTFDGPYLGVDPVAFTTSDYNALFDTFHVHPKDVEKKIRTIHAIDPKFMVSSDPFNLLSLWLLHLAPIYIHDKHVRHEFMMNVMRYYHYKIFTSVVNNSFRHGTNRGVMEATIMSLTKKSDIIRYESWKRLIDSHCERDLDPQGRFYNTIVEGGPDEAMIRVITETQTAIRAKIVLMARAYYDIHASGETVKSQSAVSENADGEKIIAQTASVIESASSAMIHEVLNTNMFVNDGSIRDIKDLFTPISERMLKNAILKINEEAVLQAGSRGFDKVEKHGDAVIFVGIRALIMEIIRTMIHVCHEKRVDMGSHDKVFSTMRDSFSSSRLNKGSVANIKLSVSHLIDPFEITTNEAAKSALRLGVIYYFIYRILRKM